MNPAATLPRKLSAYLSGLLALLLLSQTETSAQTTVTTYQGSLLSSGSPATGSHDFTFTLHDAVTAGNQIGGAITQNGVVVTGGLFTVPLDFGGTVFDGTDRWLQIGVRPSGGGGGFVPLAPRAPITAAPYAIRAGQATALSGVLAGGQLAGIYGNPVTFNNGANAFTGAAGGLTGLNATELTTGTVPSAALGNAWRTGGNPGTTAGTHFLGTTDNQPFEMKVNGTRALRLEPTVTSPNVLGGSAFNSRAAGMHGVTIGGGGTMSSPNQIDAVFATIGGGLGNRAGAGANYAVIGGGVQNLILADAASAAIGGGNANGIGTGADSSTISGGSANNIAADALIATIAGGQLNDIGTGAIGGTVSGGVDNNLGSNATFATIAGGRENNILANAPFSMILGGRNNAVGNSASYAFAAGRQAKANHTGAFVWADSQNADFASTAANQFLIRAAGGVAIGTSDPAGAALRVAGSVKADSFLGMGGPLMIGTTGDQPLEFKVNGLRALRLEDNGDSSLDGDAIPDGAPNFIGGSSSNMVAAGVVGATISGGGSTNLYGFPSPNSIAGDFATIGGGDLNTIGINAVQAVISGGTKNWIGANARQSVIGGGDSNVILDGSENATIGGGLLHRIEQSASGVTIGGGLGNQIKSAAFAGTIGGGRFNTINTGATNSTIGGGLQNLISNAVEYATIPGGRQNTVLGSYGFAAGRRARANHAGTFVWADSQDADFASTVVNQFNVRAAGGARFVGPDNSGTTATLVIQGGGNQLLMDGNEVDSDGNLFLNFNSGNNVLIANANSRLAIGFSAPAHPVHHVSGAHLTAAGVWTSVSDRNAKRDFTPINPESVLARVVALPVSQWRYQVEAEGVTHIGPMAQDFRAAFGLGESDTAITSIDADGVALAAIQGLNQKVEQQGADLKQKQTEIADLKQRLERLEQLLK